MDIFRINPHRPQTLVWWWRRKDQIDFDPPYQRKGRLWSQSDKAYLIDSIINGFDIPKLYLADFQIGQSPLNVKKLPYAIIDGKQRLEAIFDFFEGKFVLDPDFKYRKEPGLRVGGLSLKDLRESHGTLAEEFENASLDIMSVYASSERDINEIFIRLNRSKPLTGAEIRNAMSGPVAAVIRTLSEMPVFKETIRFSTARAADLNAAAKVLMFEYYDTTTSTKKDILDTFAKGETVEKSLLEAAAYRTTVVLDAMNEIFLPKDPLLSSAGIFPVYYWLVRNVDPEKHPLIRQFLVSFERERKNNREIQTGNPHAAKLDQELIRFDTLNRSTNDQVSHKVRYEILRRRFDSATYIFG